MYPKQENWMGLRNAQEALLSEQGDEFDVLSKDLRLSCSSVLPLPGFSCMTLKQSLHFSHPVFITTQGFSEHLQ